MKFFTDYKKSSCVFENNVEILLKDFQCLPYFMPKVPVYVIKTAIPSYTNESIICSPEQLKRMAKKYKFYSAVNTGGKDSRFIKPHEYETISCPDECDSLKYTSQVSYAPFEDNGNFFYESLLRKGNKTDPPISVAFFKEYQKFIKETFKKVPQSDWDRKILGPPELSWLPMSTGCVEQTVKNKIKKMTFLHVFFNNLGVTKFSKSELYGWQDLVGLFGGIVGLCMGFSLLSGAELIYFFTIRYLVDSHRERKGVGISGESSKDPDQKEGGGGEGGGGGGLNDGLLFDIIFANDAANKSPVKSAPDEKPSVETAQPAKSPQVKAKEAKKPATKK